MKALRISSKLAVAAIILCGCNLVGFAQESTDANDYEFTISPFVRFIEVEGNRSAFSQHTMLEDGFDAGFDFTFSAISEEQGSLDISGMSTFDQSDYELDVAWKSASRRFFINAGFEQYHRYYDNTGWFYEDYDVPVWSLGRDLSVEIGKFGVELGFRPDPDKLTEFVIGYQYHWKDGEKTTLADNDQTQDGVRHYTYPSHVTVDDESHVLTLSATVDLDFVLVRDQFRYESYEGKGLLFEVSPEGLPGNSASGDVGRLHRHKLEFSQYSNAFSLEKWVSDGLLLSGGYLYSNYDGNMTERYQYLRFGTANRQHFDRHDDLSLEQEAHVFNLNAMWLPAVDWAIIAGLSAEFGETDVTGEAQILETINNSGTIGPLHEPLFDSTLDKFGLTESLEVRYTGIAGTVLYVRGEFTQEDYEQRELTEEAGSITSDRDSDTDRSKETYRAGFTPRPALASPWGPTISTSAAASRTRSTPIRPRRDTRPSSPGRRSRRTKSPPGCSSSTRAGCGPSTR